MIISKLGSLYTDRQMYKSFQPEISKTATASTKKQELFRSNIDNFTGGTLLIANIQSLSHKEYLNESIKDLSSNDESVAEERESSDENATVHQTIPNPHQNLNSELELYNVRGVSNMEESKEYTMGNNTFDNY